MASPRDRLCDAIDAWLRDDARETVARWRGDPDADDRAAVARRHERLVGPAARELFEEASDRGELRGDERVAVAAWLRARHEAPGRARAAARVAAILARPVAHDSDFHAPGALVARMLTEPHAGRRRAAARDLGPWLARLERALRDGLADVLEAREGARWLRDVPPRPDDLGPEAPGGAPPAGTGDDREEVRAPGDAADAPGDDPGPLVHRPTASERRALGGAARDPRAATDDAWAELLERLAHAAGTDLAHWADLAHALRAPALDDRFDPARRGRRLAAHLAPLGLQQPLSARARAEPAATDPLTLRASVVALDVPRDVRVRGGLELGLMAERQSALGVGRALAIALTAPALSPLLSRPGAGTVGRAFGGLWAHLHADPIFVERALGLRGADARAVRELALAQELFTLRTEAARAALAASVDDAGFADVARESLREAWHLEPDPAMARALALPVERHPGAAVRAARWIPALHVALRERFDEDWWRNPRTAELLRAACARGPTLTVEAWAEELGADGGALADRVDELLG
ncbi:MAG TPA: hypothetical protein RMH99_22840 [Sandaracinaceae bacterium LLY-WYZ-13_1]|nr:hypothetical protein [Sandaracinaceae bacterium LLY-WYZ-13_1]